MEGEKFLFARSGSACADSSLEGEERAVLTVSTLKSYTAKDLAQMAKKRGVSGWHSMTKDQLVKALARTAKAAATKSTPARSARGKAAGAKSANGVARVDQAAKSAAKRAPLGSHQGPGRNGSSKNGSSKNGSSKNGSSKNGSSKAAAAGRKSSAGSTTPRHGQTSRPGGLPRKSAAAKSAPAKSSAAKRTGTPSSKPDARAATPQAGKPVAKPAVRKSATRAATVHRIDGGKSGTGSKGSSARSASAVRPKSAGVMRRIQQVHQAREAKMDLAKGTLQNGASGHMPQEDRIVLLVRDPYWLQAHWELTSRCVERAQAALKERWHSARPVLRLLSISNSNVSNNAECVVRVIDIHGAVHNWFIDVQDPPSSFRVEIGYLTSDDHFYALARSNPVTTPRPGSADMLENNWADLIDNPDKVFALSGGHDEHGPQGGLQSLFEERLRRPMGSPMVTRFGNGAEAALNRDREMPFSIDAEMVVYGVTSPQAYVTMSGEPVKLREDGTFVARVSLPDRRQVIPIVASSQDGVEERTIVLAVEKNTKVMEPKLREPGE